MMTDLFYSLHSAKKTKDLQVLVPKPRLQSAPVIPKYKRTPDEDAPKTQLHHPIILHSNYLDADYAQNLKSIQKLNEIASSFFNSRSTAGAPYTDTEWANILRDRTKNATEHTDRLSSSLRDGLPLEMRKNIWIYLAHVNYNQRVYQEKGMTYESLKNQACTYEEKIKLDVGRTCADHTFWHNNTQEKLKSLYQILRAYANFDPEVGYAQGINLIVAMLLSLIYGEDQPDIENNQIANNEGSDKENSLAEIEKEVFWMLVYIMQEKGWRFLFVKHTPKLNELLEKLDTKVKDNLPNLHVTLKKYNCLALCFVEHFITIMLCKSPPELAKRILEIFLLVGEEILLHIITNMLALCEKEIYEREECDELFCFLKEHLLTAISK